jgi:hypothetical protein
MCSQKLNKKTADMTVKTMQEFKEKVGLIRGLEGDNEFFKRFYKTKIVTVITIHLIQV